MMRGWLTTDKVFLWDVVRQAHQPSTQEGAGDDQGEKTQPGQQDDGDIAADIAGGEADGNLGDGLADGLFGLFVHGSSVAGTHGRYNGKNPVGG